MKTAIKAVLVVSVAWMATQTLRAVEGLQIRVVGTDVVLDWPSQAGETFLITWRPDYETNTTWQWLSTNLPAAAGTNRTTFVHTNGADCSAMAMMAVSGSGGQTYGGESSQFPNGAEDFINYKFPKQPWNKKVQSAIANSYPGILPALPWDEKLQAEIVFQHDAQAAALSQSSSGGVAMMTGSGCISAGFYKVAREGIHFIGLTNGTLLTGDVFLPIEVGTVANDPLVIGVFADGIPLPQARIEKSSDGSLAARFNSAFLPNGSRQIWPLATYGFDQAALRSYTNTVSVDNNATFFDFTTSFGGQIWFYAELKVTTADFEIRIANAQSGYLGSLYSSTTDGLINGTWVPQIGGNPVTNETLQATFIVTPPGGPTTTNGPLTYTRETGTSGNWFIVARAEDFINGVPDDYNEIVYNGVVNVIAHPIYNDPYDLSPGNVPFGGTTFQFTDQTRSELLLYLADAAYGNFFWWGHGNPSAIGYTYHGADPSTNKVGISAAEVASLLGNTNRITRPYHLTFIHGCQAARGAAWPTAFGVVPVPTVKQAYFNNDTQPRAFVSAIEDISLIPLAQHLPYAESLAGFFGVWMLGGTVGDALYEATRPQEVGETRIPLDPAGDWTIYGAVDLQRIDITP